MDKTLRIELERRAAALLNEATFTPEKLHEIANCLMNIHVFGVSFPHETMENIVENKQRAYAAFGELVTLLTD